MKSIIATLGMMIALSSAAHAGFYDGNELHQHCSDVNSPYYEGFCIAYIAAAADDMPCLNNVENLNAGQVRDVVKKYLNDHPERRQYNANFLSRNAIGVAFCDATDVLGAKAGVK